VKSFLTTRSKLGKSLLITTTTLLFIAGCSSESKKASSEPTASPPAQIISSSPTPDSTPTPESTPTADPTPTTSTQPKTKESKSVITPSATPTPIKSKAPSKPSPSTKELTNAELALKYPPTIGTLVPWYFPTPEQAGKAYTNLKPYETGETYALYQEEGSIIWVYASSGSTKLDGDTVVWGAFRIFRINASEIRVKENQTSSYGMNQIKLLGCDSEGCSPVLTMESIPIRGIPSNLDGVWQSWSPIIIIR
jgi:hypothetical protein